MDYLSLRIQMRMRYTDISGGHLCFYIVHIGLFAGAPAGAPFTYGSSL